jgi:hypothetical protein
MLRVFVLRSVLLAMALLALAPVSDAMCCFFSRPIITDVKQPTILQPSQIAFITWDPDKKIETVTVQARFEGSADEFGMVIPTPSQPKLHEMPRDFFKALGLVTQPKRRVNPDSKLMPQMFGMPGMGGFGMAKMAGAPDAAGRATAQDARPTTVKVVEVGQVGNLDYKIINAGRADDLFQWLKDNKYNYAGDEATLNFYIQKKYFFTVMKIDALQMKRGKDGKFIGDVAPTRFTFSSEKLVYPLKITQISITDKTDALFYVQAPYKMDLQGDLSYQYHWLSMLEQTEQQFGDGDLLPTNKKWLTSVRDRAPNLIKRGQELGFTFALGQELPVNKKGHKPTSLEWSKKLTADDIAIICGDRPYNEEAPDPDWGFTAQDLRDPQRAAAVMKVISFRVNKYNQAKPRGYLVRNASTEEVQSLPILKGHVQEGQYLTKFYHTFTRDEMNEDLVMVPAKAGNVEDRSEHEELFRTMQFGGRFGGPPFRGGPGGGLPIQPPLIDRGPAVIPAPVPPQEK